MTITKKFTLVLLTILPAAAMLAFTLQHPSDKIISLPPATAKIQVAVLLDVSNSMDGLIEQAKAQLWNMVSVMGKAKCSDSNAPQIEIALYEYGRSNNAVAQGYVKQINEFSQDLDQVSKNLFGLTTNGGDEYCGHVILSSINELKWDTTPGNYKVIFISGNEDFLQGDVPFTKACAKAKEHGVIVNTIYCGNKAQGIKEHWNLGSECGLGSFTNIDADARIDDIPTPYDSTIFVLNNQLNSTYIGYGTLGYANTQKQAEVDQMNYKMNKSVAAKRVAVKGKKALYRNATWDLVDAQNGDAKFMDKVDLKALPDSLKGKSREYIKQVVTEKSNQRNAIQQQIAGLSVQRDTYIAVEKAKQVNNKNTATLESEVEKIIREQAKRYNMVIE